MKRLLIALALAVAVALPAVAQEYLKMKDTSVVSISSSSASTSSGVSEGVYYVRIVGTSDFFVAVGATPVTAVTSDAYVPADRPEIFKVSPGQYIAVLRDTADGSAYITEMTR